MLVVGGGVMGTLHAREAIERGFEVRHFEAAPETRQSSVRSFGFLTFSSAAPGLDLEFALEARRRWFELLGHEAPELLRPTTSLVVAADSDELAALEKLATCADADDRGWELLDRINTESAEPALAGDYTGALRSDRDALIDPTASLRVLREQMAASDNYRFLPGSEVLELQSDAVVDHTGRVTRGDFVVACTGSNFRLASSVLGQPSALRPLRIQALHTRPGPHTPAVPITGLPSLLSHGLGDGTLPSRPVTARDTSVRIQVKCVPRPDGGMLIGEVLDPEDPEGFDLRERPMTEVTERLERMLGAAIPDVTRRWSGTVHESMEGRLWFRSAIDEAVVVVGGTDERGFTLAPAIARDTFDWLVGGIDSGASSPGAAHS